MANARPILLLASCLALAACAPDAPQEDEEPVAQSPAPVPTDTMADGTLGPLQYEYDTAALTRAEISLPLPPEFIESVFAVKFLPSDLMHNIGSDKCSYEEGRDNSHCTAEQEIGLALALLERPIEDYGEPIFELLTDEMSVETASIAGHEGFALEMQHGGAALRYTFVPVDARTLLVVERSDSAHEIASGALDAVRESLRFPED